jgi:hypothetical protein
VNSAQGLQSRDISTRLTQCSTEADFAAQREMIRYVRCKPGSSMLRPYKRFCASSSLHGQKTGLAGDGLGDSSFLTGVYAALEEAARGEQLGVEQGGAGGATHQIVRKQR